MAVATGTSVSCILRVLSKYLDQASKTVLGEDVFVVNSTILRGENHNSVVSDDFLMPILCNES